MGLYHISAWIETGSTTVLHDSMYDLPTPNLADGWLPKVREVIHDFVAADTGRRFPVESVTIISISPL
jgi:hypothetical protein